jgi:Transcriptional regulator, AbiEi antitoxin, Type IV TA system
MRTGSQLPHRILRIVTAALPDGLRVDVQPRPHTTPRAYDVTVRAGAAEHRFTAGWAGEGWPADVEPLARLIPDLEVVVATHLSDGARKWLRDARLSWVDEVGHAEIITPSGLVISKEPTHPRTQPERPTRWNRSTLTVAEAALAGTTPTVEGIERTTGLSRNATASALARLERLGFLDRPNAQRGPMSARHVVDSDAFLDAYAIAAAERRAKQSVVLVHRLWSDPLETLRDAIAPALNHGSVRWAVTGVAASVLLAPYLSDVTTLELYVEQDLSADQSRLASLLGGRIVERGHRIEVRELPTAMSAKGPVVDGVQVALPVRVYADLSAAGGRSAEAAHHLRETLHVGTAA